MVQGLLNEIALHGERGAVVPISRADDLKRDIEELADGEFQTRWIGRMAANKEKFIPSGLNFVPRSLISVIMPSPKVMLQFTHREQPVACIMPPTYCDSQAGEAKVLSYMNAYLAPRGYTAALADSLPQKLLAVHCGLGVYGRNNVCFSEEFGSYIHLQSYVSDLPCQEAPWFPLRRMEACRHCQACVASCPTGAIDSVRHLINSNNCLTSMNEQDGDFPHWVDPDAHNAVFGCVRCQDCCPGNAHNRGNTVQGLVFTEEETAELLQHKAGEAYSNLLEAKIEAIGGISDWTHLLPRNLAALLQKTARVQGNVTP